MLHFFDSKYSKNCFIFNIVTSSNNSFLFQYILNCRLIYFLDGKTEFSAAITPVFILT